MTTVVVGCDSNGDNDSEYQSTVASIIEKAGFTVEKLAIDSNAFASYSDGSNGKNPNGKIGVYLIAAGTYSIADATFGTSKFKYNFFGIRPECSPNWDVSDFDTKPIGADADCPGWLCSKIAGNSFKKINELVKEKSMVVTGKDATEMGNNLVTAINGGGFVGSSSNQNDSGEGSEDEEEEWDDKDNFTPHKGKIMEIKPYKEISSISFDKSYDSPTGTGNVEVLFNSKDYRFLYKGVAMKLKLRRSCDKEFSATGLEEPDYSEDEKFFKEHIPTNELLEELGLPNYRKQRPLGNTDTGNDGSSNNGDSNNGGESVDSSIKLGYSTSNSSGRGITAGSSNSSSLRVSASSSNSSGRGITAGSSNSSSRSVSGKRKLNRQYINSLTPSHASALARRTNEYDSATIKALRRRAMGLYW